ncbi:hypothetical protein [Nitrolancea hollandica]|uniref:Nucleotide modification associated domain-containing protein n=1 Tax=Nitrolancea hollandica Lb TaxID=1129897 RepID=I4EFK3_9BACT|nr:hypothetical protein [Nitrolancea hollandica]CCF83465.1 hypothetical protein NITHO_2310008 [Nitrolancea hollandica Lb]
MGPSEEQVIEDLINSLNYLHTSYSGHEPHPSSSKFYRHIVDAAILHAKKQADYGQANDPFANVRASSDWGMPAWVGVMMRATDKVKRLQAFAQRGVLTNESAKDSLADIAVYALIALVLMEEEDGDLSA